MMHRLFWVGALAAGFAATPALAADKIKVGYVNTFTGPGGILGKHYRDAFDLALGQLGGKLGGLPAEVIYGDDQLKPDIAKSVVERMIERDKVDLLAGCNFSNTLLAAADVAFAAKTIVISSNAGPSLLAGAQCTPYFFAAGHHNDGAAESMGRYLQEQNLDNVFSLAPNYQAGKDMLAGFKRGFKGRIVSETYTQLTQNDFSAELSQIRSANPAAVFTFMPGGNGINFVKQWSQAGLIGRIPLYSVYTVDHVTLGAIGEAAVGTLTVAHWTEDLPNPENVKFVANFVAKYNYMPSMYAAKAFDTAMLIDSAVRAVHGKIEDKESMIAALRKADFKSVRGSFRFNTNQFAIQDYFLRETVKQPDGKLGFVTRATVVKGYVDPNAADCKMK
jgi:branched-chain amino acid transport system substrate-binding protein